MTDIKREITSKLEQEQMEIEALEAQMLKSTNVSKQAISIMDSIDSRLLRLETSILPIHGSTQKLSKVYENMESALYELEIVMGYIEAASSEDKILSQEPSKSSDLDQYFSSMNRLREAFSFITDTAKLTQADAVKSAQKALLSKSTKSLDALLKVWLIELSQATKSQYEVINKLSKEETDGIQEMSNLPSELFNKALLLDITKVINYLASIENDSSIHGTSAPTTNFSKTVIDIRSNYLNQILSFALKTEGDKKQVDSSGPYAKNSTFMLAYTRLLLYLLIIEWNFVLKIVPSVAVGNVSMSRTSKTNTLKVVFESIMQTVATSYSNATESLLVKCRRNIVQNHDFMSVLVVFDILNMFYLENDGLPKKQLDSLKLISKKISSVRSSFNEYTAICFKTFTEFLDEIRHSNKNSHLPEDGIVHEISSNALGFLKRLSDYLDICELLLRVLQNLPRWEEFLQPSSPSSDIDDVVEKVWQVKINGNDGDQIDMEKKYMALHRYCVEAVDLLSSNLEEKAKAYKKGISGEKSSKSTLATIFLLNNYQFILKSLRVNPELLAITGKEVENKLSIRIQEEMDTYMECWKTLLTKLMDPAGAKLMKSQLSKSERNTVKEIFKEFNEEFEVQFKHQKKYSIPDVDLRNEIVKKIKQLLVPMYSRVYERYKNVDFTKNPEKYLKYDVSSLELAIGKFFDPVS